MSAHCSFASARALLLATSLVCLLAETASAVPIGAGTGITLEVMDTTNGGPRTNIDESFTQILGPGSYFATDFSYATGRGGQATPFLAVLIGADQYQVIALGDTVNIPGAETQTVPFGGTNAFNLPAATTVYAGFTNPPGAIDNPIWLDNNTVGTTTDHDATALNLITSVGDIVDGFSHTNLPRTYAFSVNVEQIPEPGTFVLAGIGVLGTLLLARRKRQQG